MWSNNRSPGTARVCHPGGFDGDPGQPRTATLPTVTDTSQPRPDSDTTGWYLDHYRAEADRLAGALATGPLDAPVAACPGWDVAQLARHVGQVHRWAAICIREGRSPGPDDLADVPPFDPDDAAAWYRACADDLVPLLAAIDPAAPTWHPFPAAQVAGVWPRRMAHETAVHRWDAEHAIGQAPGLDAWLASDGIDEYFEVMVPRRLASDAAVPEGSLHVHCTDVEGEWLVWAEGGEYRMIRAHQKGDAALRGPAADLLLRLWSRPVADGALSPVGDDGVLASWLAVGGN